MPKLTIQDQKLSCDDDETVLETLLSNGIDIPFGCMQGSCHSCLIKSLDAIPPDNAQIGLKNTQCLQKMFLACQCHPEQNMHLELINTEQYFISAIVESISPLNDETIRLIINCQEKIDYFAGQFVNLRRNDGLTRSYSIANPTSQGNVLEFHIRLLKDGKFSQWAGRDLKTGDELQVQGPLGDCFYFTDQPTQNILLIGTGSGLAPLMGMLLEALEKGHTGGLHLFHGSRNESGLYLVDEMRKLAERYPNVHYTPCLSGETVPLGFTVGRAHEVALKSFPKLNDWRIYLCGHPAMVNEAKKSAFFAGVSPQQIYADPFVLTHPPK